MRQGDGRARRKRVSCLVKVLKGDNETLTLRELPRQPYVVNGFFVVPSSYGTNGAVVLPPDTPIYELPLGGGYSSYLVSAQVTNLMRLGEPVDGHGPATHPPHSRRP